MTTTSRDKRPGTRSRGRGAAAAFGFILLFAGLIGGGVLFVLSLQRHDKAIENFARAGVGCTTSLEFSKSGTFYVYQETAGTFDPQEIGCEPQATPDQAFSVKFSGPSPVSPRPDNSISYDTGDFTGASVARFEITQSGTYEIGVGGDSTDVWAAIGRDPSDNVDEMRQGAIIIAAIGVVLGGLLLALAGWRSKRASTPSIPEGPGWGPRPGDGGVRVATRATPDPAGAGQSPPARHAGVGGTTAATAPGAGAGEHGAASITVGAARSRGRTGAHDAAGARGAGAPARPAAGVTRLTAVRAGASR